MTILSNFPIVSQLTQITDDGKPSENAQEDCVAACICAMVMFLKGVRAVDADYNPDLFKDKAYSDSYVGATDASKYVAFCASLGVRLYPVSANPAHLVALAHQYLAEGKPVIFTEPDPYVSASLGWTHVCCFYADGPGTLVAMDPYIARPVSRTDAEWTQLLQFNQIWIAEDLPMNTIPAGWHDDGTTLTAPNGVPVVHGFRDYVIASGWHPDNWPLGPEYGTPELEYSNPSLGGGTQQVFRWSMLGWTQQHGVFLEWLGVELLRWKSQMTKLLELYQADEAKLAAQPVAADSAQLADLQVRLNVAKGLATQLTTALTIAK